MTLGQLLQSKRIESGRSLEQVAASTKIHAKILAAIEGDHYSVLPARAFTRGFIVNYAKALKLDSEQILKDHHEFLEQKFSERPARDQGHQGYAFEGKELEQNRRWMVIGATLAILFAVAVLLVFKPQNTKHNEKNKEFEEETAQTSEETEVPVNVGMPPILNSTPNGVSASGSPAIATPSVTAQVDALIANKNATQSPAASSSPSPAASATASASPSPSPTATATPKATATPTPSPTATPTITATPAASPSALPAEPVKEDKLNKGDGLTRTEAKRKVSFEAKEDVWVRYRSDDRPMNVLILRKGRFLVIKAKEKLSFEVNHPESVVYKTRGGYAPLTVPKAEVTEAGIQAYEGSDLGTKPLPESAPASPGQ